MNKKIEELIILNKTYIGDLKRSLNLFESIEKYNKDNIPFVLSVPKKDYSVFRSNFPKEVLIYTDEKILLKGGFDIKKIKKIKETKENSTGWFVQQFIKLAFFNFKKCKNYITIDSDSYFIKNFYLKNFIDNDGIPYTIAEKQGFLLNDKYPLNDALGLIDHKEVKLLDAFREIMRCLGGDINKNKSNYYISGYAVWSSKVLGALEKNIKEKHNWTFFEMIMRAPYEMQWYGQFIELSRIIPLKPINKVFYVIGTNEQYKKMIIEAVDIYVDKEFKDYLGVIFQSRIIAANGALRYKLPLRKLLKNRFKKIIKDLKKITKFLNKKNEK